MSFFDYAAALESVKNNPAGIEFLEANKARFEYFGTAAGWNDLVKALSLFGQRKNTEAWKLIYTDETDLDTLGKAFEQGVENSAQLAQRYADLSAAIQKTGFVALQILLGILSAGFCR
jgi:hypothetical protein